MKRIITSTIVLFASTLAVVAQLNVQVTDGDGVVQNGNTIIVYDDPTAGTMHADLFSENMSSSNIVVNVKRYEMGVQPGTKNFFCWGVCYGSIDAGAQPLWISDDEVNMAPDSLYNNFHAYHQPENMVGVSCYRYVWYDMSQPNDSIWVDICFDTESVGIEENGIVSELNVYPNPSLGSVNFDIVLESFTNDAQLVIHNLLGERVWSTSIQNNEQKIVLGEGELTPGIYFYSIEANGRVAVTEKLIIAQQ